MAISAKRFQFLDEETNVATMDFFSPASSDIFNSVNNELKDITASTEEFIAAATQAADIPVDASTADSAIRTVKSLAGSIKDLTNVSAKDIDKLVSGILPDNPLVQSAFNKLSTSCKTGALSNNSLGKPYDPSMNCNGNTRPSGSGSCNSGDFGNILNKLSNGQYNSVYSDLNAKLQSLMGLANYGYSMNMCGVFGALAGGLDKNMLSRASGGLLDILTSKGNTMGAFDLIASSAGLSPLLENPNGLSSLVNGFNIPNEICEANYSDLSDMLTSSADALDDTWNLSSYDNMLSTSILENTNSDLNEVFKSSVMDSVVDEDNLDHIYNGGNNSLTAFMAANKDNFPSIF